MRHKQLELQKVNVFFNFLLYRQNLKKMIDNFVF